MPRLALLREEIREHIGLAERERAEAERLLSEAASLRVYRCAAQGRLCAEKARLEEEAEMAQRRATAHVLKAAALHEQLTASSAESVPGGLLLTFAR